MLHAPLSLQAKAATEKYVEKNELALEVLKLKGELAEKEEKAAAQQKEAAAQQKEAAAHQEKAAAHQEKAFGFIINRLEGTEKQTAENTEAIAGLKNTQAQHGQVIDKHGQEIGKHDQEIANLQSDMVRTARKTAREMINYALENGGLPDSPEGASGGKCHITL